MTFKKRFGRVTRSQRVYICWLTKRESQGFWEPGKRSLRQGNIPQTFRLDLSRGARDPLPAFRPRAAEGRGHRRSRDTAPPGRAGGQLGGPRAAGTAGARSGRGSGGAGRQPFLGKLPGEVRGASDRRGRAAKGHRRAPALPYLPA